jgi:transcriptional regulator with GAF, ATPase, and Fis domain
MRPKLKCKRVGCSNFATKIGQVYCSRDCAPLGYMSREFAIGVSDYKNKLRAAKAAKQKQILEGCAAQGMNLYEAAEELGLALNTTAVYCRKWNIDIKRKKRT